MWGVFNENRLIKIFDDKEDAEEYQDKNSRTWQSCGFYSERVIENECDACGGSGFEVDSIGYPCGVCDGASVVYEKEEAEK